MVTSPSISASTSVSSMRSARGSNKVNTAARGNVTSQLHVHVVGRRRDDPLWPDPLWGRGGGVAYPEGELERLAKRIGAEIAS